MAFTHGNHTLPTHEWHMRKAYGISHITPIWLPHRIPICESHLTRICPTYRNCTRLSHMALIRYIPHCTHIGLRPPMLLDLGPICILPNLSVPVNAIYYNLLPIYSKQVETTHRKKYTILVITIKEMPICFIRLIGLQASYWWTDGSNIIDTSSLVMITFTTRQPIYTSSLN
jgi:hypothetical protein